MDPWQLAAITIPAAAYLTYYFATYKPHRPATVALTLMLVARIIQDAALIIHTATHHDPTYYPLITLGRVTVTTAVYLVLLIVLRHQV